MLDTVIISQGAFVLKAALERETNSSVQSSEAVFNRLFVTVSLRLPGPVRQ